MYKYGPSSQDRISTLHPKLQRVVRRAMSYQVMDISIISGHREPRDQQELYAIGRTKPGKIVTYKDGITKLSKHNKMPSEAFDAMPYPSGFTSTDEQWGIMAGLFMAAAKEEKVEIEWGGNFKSFKDKPHIQLKGL